MNLTYELDPYNVKVNHYAKCLRPRLFYLQVIVQAHDQLLYTANIMVSNQTIVAELTGWSKKLY